MALSLLLFFKYAPFKRYTSYMQVGPSSVSHGHIHHLFFNVFVFGGENFFSFILFFTIFRYWWIKIQALAEAGEWVELDKFSRNKKPPVGMEVSNCAFNKQFVDIFCCLGNELNHLSQTLRILQFRTCFM